MGRGGGLGGTLLGCALLFVAGCTLLAYSESSWPLSGAPQQVELVSRPPSQLTVHVPLTWRVGQKLAVKIPGGRTIAVAAPPGQRPGSSFAIGLGAPRKVGRTQLMMAEVLHPHLKQIAKPLTKLKSFLHSDLTSYSSMLAYERKLRSAMGHMKNKWPDKKFGLKKFMVKNGAVLADNFWSEGEEAEGAEGFDKNLPNGFDGGKPDYDNLNGVPGYTYVTNGEDLGVEDKGPGYYQPEDPEHWQTYLDLVHSDCFSAKGNFEHDHSNCASLVKRSHHYKNADPGRFSGAFGWNPPFAAGPEAKNAKGAKPIDPNEYWNYGNDDDLASANSWDGKEYVPAEEEPALSSSDDPALAGADAPEEEEEAPAEEGADEEEAPTEDDAPAEEGASAEEEEAPVEEEGAAEEAPADEEDAPAE
mmetsp:Transcript_58005/g.138376  ORF Transcript_58005/g.138376 Transcript_58005/m.138376 type:complete len:416 (+) Transcript_58005:66-1313(+)